MKIIIYILILIFSIQLYGGKISNFKNKIKKEKYTYQNSDDDDDDSDNNYYYSDYDDDNYSPLGDFFFDIFFHLYFGDLNKKIGYSSYPYKSESGLYDKESDKEFIIKASTNYIHGNQLKGADFSVKLAGTHFGLRVDITNMWERENNGKEDKIKFFNGFLDFYGVKKSELTHWIGFGIKGVEGEIAVAIDLGLELFIAKPLSVYLDYNVGFYEAFTLQEVDASLNIHANRYFLKIGYHNYFIEKTDIGGPTIGVGGYF